VATFNRYHLAPSPTWRAASASKPVVHESSPASVLSAKVAITSPTGSRARALQQARSSLSSASGKLGRGVKKWLAPARLRHGADSVHLSLKFRELTRTIARQPRCAGRQIRQIRSVAGGLTHKVLKSTVAPKHPPRIAVTNAGVQQQLQSRLNALVSASGDGSIFSRLTSQRAVGIMSRANRLLRQGAPLSHQVPTGATYMKSYISDGFSAVLSSLSTDRLLALHKRNPVLHVTDEDHRQLSGIKDEKERGQMLAAKFKEHDLAREHFGADLPTVPANYIDQSNSDLACWEIYDALSECLRRELTTRGVPPSIP